MTQPYDVRVGLGLWSMRSTVYEPASWAGLYAQLRADAHLAEDLGYDTLWLAEHHFWYDGWCPQPLVAIASALAATSTLRLGTAMLLLPQHDVSVVSRDVGTLLELYGDRLDVGVSLGYRDEEYDGVGVLRSQRGRRMNDHLGTLLDDHVDVWPSPPPLYVGGLAEAAIRRAGRWGAGLLLPNSLSPAEIAARRQMCADESSIAGKPAGRTGMLIDVWVTADDQQQTTDRVLDRLATHYREYAGAWFLLQGEPGFTRPDLLDKQSARTRRAAVVGTADRVTEGLLALREAGVDTFLLQVRSDVAPESYQRVMRAIAADVMPELRRAA